VLENIHNIGPISEKWHGCAAGSLNPPPSIYIPIFPQHENPTHSYIFADNCYPFILH